MQLSGMQSRGRPSRERQRAASTASTASTTRRPPPPLPPLPPSTAAPPRCASTLRWRAWACCCPPSCITEGATAHWARLPMAGPIACRGSSSPNAATGPDLGHRRPREHPAGSVPRPSVIIKRSHKASPPPYISPPASRSTESRMCCLARAAGWVGWGRGRGYIPCWERASPKRNY